MLSNDFSFPKCKYLQDGLRQSLYRRHVGRGEGQILVTKHRNFIVFILAKPVHENKGFVT